MTISESGPASPSVVSLAQAKAAERFGRPAGSWRLRAYTIIFEADTRFCKHCGKPLPAYQSD